MPAASAEGAEDLRRHFLELRHGHADVGAEVGGVGDVIRLAVDSHRGAVDALRERLFPLARIVTPNAHEAAHLTGLSAKVAPAPVAHVPFLDQDVHDYRIEFDPEQRKRWFYRTDIEAEDTDRGDP